MGRISKIEWCDATWNPVMGCTPVSQGCTRCFARAMIRRFAGCKGWPNAPGRITLFPERLEQPLRWGGHKKIFVCDMGDLFHEDVPLDYIADVFNIMAQCQQHTFQILTKRPARARAVISDLHEWNYADTTWTGIFPSSMTDAPFPLPNVHLGVSVENQATVDERREYLRQTPAAVKFVSYEPALGPVDWAGWGFVNQIISGGESGPKARPSYPYWHRNTRDFCQANGIAYFFKGWGAWAPYIESSFVGEITGHMVLSDGTFGEFGDGKPGVGMSRVGKKRAGRLLDGKEWNEFPSDKSS